MRAIVLISGGLDSATTAAQAIADGYDVVGLSIDYQQRHRVELERAVAVASSLGITDHRVVRVDLRAIGGSALTAGFEVPKSGVGPGIPTTYVPARNTVFLAVALGLAEVEGAFDIFIGANAIDYSGYPDCRPAFIEAFESLANVATKAAVEGRGRFRVRAPLLELSKGQIIERARDLGVDLSLTVSCYDPGPEAEACGACDSCRLRRKGFAEAGIADPTRYRT